MDRARNNHIELAAELASAHVAVTSGQLRLLSVVARCLLEEAWQQDGSRDLSEWLSTNLGISRWAARRWINAALALPQLPRISEALASGRLTLDKVLELCRFATAETEKGLITWARRVTLSTVRHQADLAKRPCLEVVAQADKQRFLNYWWSSDGKALEIYGSLPADKGAFVAKALDRLAERAPDIIECHCQDDASSECDCAPSPPEESLELRRADALVALASAQIASDQDPDRATLVVHAELSALRSDEHGCELEQGPVIHPETARRLGCDARVQFVIYERGLALGIGRVSRTVPAWLLRQLRRRDRGCTFPGCEARRFLHAHHIWHWIQGGPTDLGNLILVCPYHHTLVHEHRWRVELGARGPAWFRPNGRRFEPLDDGLEVLAERSPPVALVS